MRLIPASTADRRAVAGVARRAATGSRGSVAEIGIPLLVAPLLLFPRGFLPLLGLVAILGLWLAKWVVWRTLFQSNPLGLPMLLFLVMAAQALYPSVDISISMPKLYGIVLGVAVYYGVANGVFSRRVWWIAVGALMVAAVAVAAVGLVSTAWITSKLPDGAAIYSRIPRLISSVPSSHGAIAGIQPNELGGTLAFLLPIPLALLLWSLFPPRPLTHSLRLPLAVAALLTVLVAGSVLLLTVSRSALIGTSVAVGLLVGLRWHRVGVLLTAGTVAAGIAVLVIGPLHVYEWAVQVDQAVRAGGSTLVSRQEVWNRALYMIQDFPFTGIGLNTFPRVLDTLYPSFLAGPDAKIPHAHDIYLQTAVDLGISGLMAFVGLWLIVGSQAVQAYRKSANPLMKGAVAGLAAGCVAYLVYGLTDAITLGAKPLPLLWAMVGLIVAANRLLPTTIDKEDSLGDTPNPARGRTLLDPRLVLREVGKTVWMLYWAVAILFAGMAYLVIGICISGWVP